MFNPDMFTLAVPARERLSSGTILAMVAQGVMGVDVPSKVSPFYRRSIR